MHQAQHHARRRRLPNCPDGSQPGPNGCPVETHTIGELWTLGDDVGTKIQNVCVTAIRPTTRMWIQDPAWTPASATSGGLFVFFGGGTVTTVPATVKVGDRITLEGKTTTFKGAFELTEIKAINVVQTTRLSAMTPRSRRPSRSRRCNRAERRS